MFNGLNYSQELLFSTDADSFAGTPNARDVQAPLLQALREDNLSAFQELIRKKHPEIGFNTARCDNNQNYMHVAINSGSRCIARFLAQSACMLDIDLINSKDDSGYTPIMYAAKSPTDDGELIDVLIQCGARIGLSEALHCAALRGHTETARRLLDAGADASKALAQVVVADEAHTPQARANAAKLLISLGAHVSDALDYATKSSCEEAASILLLMGANGSRALASAAISRDTNALRLLLWAGADVMTALISLAKNPDEKAHGHAVRRLILENHSRHALDSSAKLHSQTAALSRLAKDADTTAVVRLRKAIASEHLDWSELANSGNVATIKSLMPSSLMTYPEQHLRQLSLDGHFVGVKTLIAAGVPANAAMNELILQHRNWSDPTSCGAIKLLIAAGAESLPLTDDIAAAFEKRKTEIAALSEGEKIITLLSAIKKDDIAEIVMLSSGVSDAKAALKCLHQAEGLNDLEKTLGISRLINAGAISSQTLIDLVRDGDLDVAKPLAQFEDIAGDALITLIAAGDHDASRTLLSALTDGRHALTQAAENGDEDMAAALIAIGADGPGALLSLLRAGFREAAGRLIALGVDIHATLRRAMREDPSSYQSAIKDLAELGAAVQ